MGVFADLQESVVYFSKSVGSRIINEDGLRIGILTDFFIDYDEIYPQVLAIQYKTNGQYFYINWRDITRFKSEKIVVLNNAELRRGRTFPKVKTHKILTGLMATEHSSDTIEFPPLGKIILDRQIVDSHGKKVVRVNDIGFIKISGHLRVTHAEIGLRSMVRRLGFERFVDPVVKLINKDSRYLSISNNINWKHVHAIPTKSFQKDLKLNLTNEDIESFHPADLADILEDLDPHARKLIFKELDDETKASTLSEIEDEMQASLLDESTPEETANIIKVMDTDDAADLLNELDEKKAREIIDRIDDQEVKEEVQELRDYQENTAGSLMAADPFMVPATITKNEVLDIIAKDYEELDTVYDLYIVDSNDNLLGTCQLHFLLSHSDNVIVGSIMNDEDIKAISLATSCKEVAVYMNKYNLINVPVVDSDFKLVGNISIDDVLNWLLEEG